MFFGKSVVLPLLLSTIDELSAFPSSYWNWNCLASEKIWFDLFCTNGQSAVSKAFLEHRRTGYITFCVSTWTETVKNGTLPLPAGNTWSTHSDGRPRFFAKLSSNILSIISINAYSSKWNKVVEILWMPRIQQKSSNCSDMRIVFLSEWRLTRHPMLVIHSPRKFQATVCAS